MLLQRSIRLVSTSRRMIKLDQIRVSPEKIRAAALGMQEAASRLHADRRRLLKLVASLDDSWKGAASQAFKSVYEKWDADFNQLLQALSSIGIRLHDTAASYEDVDPSARDRELAAEFAELVSYFDRAIQAADLVDDDSHETTSVELEVQIYLDDPTAGPAVERSIEELLSTSGAMAFRKTVPVIHSWYSSMVAVFKKAADSDAAAASRRAIEVQMLERFQAGVDGVTGNAVASILPALNETKRAAIQVGSIFIVKVDDTIVVRQLSAREMLHWRENPALFKDPAGALAELQRANSYGHDKSRPNDVVSPGASGGDIDRTEPE
jgi:WXG100 family type VII secretion target